MNDDKDKRPAAGRRAELAKIIEDADITFDTEEHPAGTYWEGLAEMVDRYVGLLIAAAVAEERAKYTIIGDWRLDKALQHMDRLRTFAQNQDDHDFLDRYTGWLLMVRELTAGDRVQAGPI